MDFRGIVCWAWKRASNSPRGCYLSCPDGIRQHNQQLSNVIETPPMPLLLCRDHIENKGKLSSQQLRLQMEFLLGGHSPASSPALVQGPRPCRSPAPRAVVPGGRVSTGMAVTLSGTCSPLPHLLLLIHCPEMLKKRMELVSESGTSITSEVLFGPRLLDHTEDREVALPHLALPCLALPADDPHCSYGHGSGRNPLPAPGGSCCTSRLAGGCLLRRATAEAHCCRCPPSAALGPEGTPEEAR